MLAPNIDSIAPTLVGTTGGIITLSGTNFGPFLDALNPSVQSSSATYSVCYPFFFSKLPH
jgi:hypothetical protein